MIWKYILKNFRRIKLETFSHHSIQKNINKVHQKPLLAQPLKHCGHPPPLSAEGGGIEPPTRFSKGGGLDRTSTFRGGCWEREG